LPSAARAAGRWIGSARRMTSQFTSELDRELKAEDLRQELRKVGDVGLDDVQKTVRDALDEAKKYESMVKPVQQQLDQANHSATSELEKTLESPINLNKSPPGSGDASDTHS